MALAPELDRSSQFLPSNLRKSVLQMAYNGNSVHVACAFSLIEIMHVLYSRFVDGDKIKTKDPDRDYVCLSKGHGVMALYAALHELGLIKDREIKNYFSDGSRLPGLSEVHVPGVEVSGGSLGQGITVATGIALGKKLDGSSSKVFCIVGDGEINEGSTWESMLICAHQKLKNFILIVDANDFQAMGRCETILSLDPLAEKLSAFNFETRECNGHDVYALEKTLTELINLDSNKPRALVARTVKGKGVSFMENDNIWHYTRLTEDTFKMAMEEVSR